MIRGVHNALRAVPAAPGPRRAGGGATFGTALQEALHRPGEVTFSGHAQERLRQSGILLGRQDVAAIGEAVAKADSAGARESLVLMNDVAFVVSVPNRTVITVVDRARMRDNVFTNIDSAVIMGNDRE